MAEEPREGPAGSPGGAAAGPRLRAVEENIQRISDLELAARHELTPSERVSKAITDFAGSMTFVGLHILLFGGWTLWNGRAPEHLRFDPYPFGLMTMMVSLEGVFLATFVLITQNRILSQSDRRDHLDLQVSMLTEQELTTALRMLRQLCERSGVRPESDEDRRVEDLMQETNVSEVMDQIERRLPKE
jgi:uncharacterized membrane protein